MKKTIFITRTFDLVDANTKSIKKIELIVYKPYEETDKEWKCDYQLLNLDDDKIYASLGIDSFQALLLALQIIDLRLQMYNNNNTNKIHWVDSPLNDFGLINKRYEAS